MKNSLKIVFKYYKYASIIYFVGFHTYIVIDDWVFTRHISGLFDWVLFFVRPLLFTVAYFLFVSVYFWLLVFAIVLVYHKVYTSRMDKG
jgi:hypothetical protein